MKTFSVAVALLLLVLPVTAWSMGSTLNKDFEAGFQDSGADAGAATGWYAFNIGGTNAVLSGDGATVHGGSWSQKVDASAGVEGGVKAKFDVTAGRTYAVRVWVNVSGAGAAYYAVMANAEENAAAVTGWMEQGPTGGGWVQLSQTVTPTGPAITVFLDEYFGVSYWDDIEIEDVTPIIDPDGKSPTRLWLEYTSTDGAWNPFTFGGVFDGSAIMGQIKDAVYLMGDKQIAGTAKLKNTPRQIDNDEYSYKGATILGGKIYGVTGYGDFQQSTDWGAFGPIIPFDQNAAPRQKAAVDSSAVATDGTYLYAYETEGSNNDATTRIFKFAVNHADGGSISRVAPFPITITGYSRISNIGYWNGKIYAAEAFNGGQILEIDTSTGAVTELLSGPNLLPATDVMSWQGPYGFGQVARYGNKIFLATENSVLYTWELISGTWTLVSADLLQLTPLTDFRGAFGLAVKGDGVNAKYAWITSQGYVSFWDLYPPTAAGSFNDVDFDTPSSIWVNDAVVTVTGVGGFWVESQDRARAAMVVSSDTVTPGRLVTIKGTSQVSDSGERQLIPSEAVVEGAFAEPAIKPLTLINMSMGSATDSVGLRNDGMLVTVFGRVGGFDANTCTFYIDDGSGVASGIPSVTGVKVQNADGTSICDKDDSYLLYAGLPC